MKPIAITIGALALLATIVPPLLFLTGSMEQDTMKLAMLVSCLLWFVTAPMWMKAA
ncbi:MAG: hypothetical protein ACNA8L_12200 [Luteolibacter sp.]|jgi:hypothetical protein